MTGKNRLALNAAMLLSLAALLPACSSPRPYLPARSGLQAGETVTVGNNENIYAIAKAHNVSMRDLIVLNNLRPPFEVRQGQSLTLPAGSGGSFNGDMPVPQAAPRDAVEKNQLAPIEPAGVSQENLEPIAPAPATAPAQSNLTTKYNNAPLSPSTLSQPQPEAKPPVPQSVTQAEPVQALNHPAPVQKQVATTTEPTASGDGPDSMVWPVQGPILSAFGSSGQGVHNDGVNIGAPKGAPVVAAAPGTVVYAGDEMKGFGNLVLIRHAGDWVTAYAHLDRVMVKKDTVVGQGDTIGTVGKTGNVATPQLHFETRQNGKAVDPSGVIKSGL